MNEKTEKKQKQIEYEGLDIFFGGKRWFKNQTLDDITRIALHMGFMIGVPAVFAIGAVNLERHFKNNARDRYIGKEVNIPYENTYWKQKDSKNIIKLERSLARQGWGHHVLTKIEYGTEQYVKIMQYINEVNKDERRF